MDTKSYWQLLCAAGQRSAPMSKLKGWEHHGDRAQKASMWEKKGCENKTRGDQRQDLVSNQGVGCSYSTNRISAVCELVKICCFFRPNKWDYNVLCTCTGQQTHLWHHFLLQQETELMFNSWDLLGKGQNYPWIISIRRLCWYFWVHLEKMPVRELRTAEAINNFYWNPFERSKAENSPK